MALAQCWEDEVLTDLPWQATRWTGTAPTLSYQDAFLPGGVFPLYHEEANNARAAFHSRHPEAYQQMAAWTAAMGVLFPGEAQSHNGVWPTLFDMDWNLFLRVIFTNFAVRAGTHCVGVTWNVLYIHSIFERHDLETVQNFCARFWSWVVQSPLALHTVVGGHSDEHLKSLCRPGAWLLDSVYTEVLVIVGQRSPNIVYEAVRIVACRRGRRLLSARAWPTRRVVEIVTVFSTSWSIWHDWPSRTIVMSSLFPSRSCWHTLGVDQ